MPHKIGTLLDDIRGCVERIQEFTANQTLAKYSADELVRSAVERQFTIIGEAAVRLRNVAPDILARIDNHYAIIRFRNILVHGYEEIDDAIVWRTIQSDLPLLKQQVSEMIAELESAEPKA